MWIAEAEPEQVAELFHSYQHAPGICDSLQCTNFAEGAPAVADLPSRVPNPITIAMSFG